MVWVGGFDMLENYATGSLWEQLFYIGFGTCLLIGTRSYIAASWIDTEYDETNGDAQLPSFATNVRMLTSITGQVMLNTGTVLGFESRRTSR
jgi:hypothetical protein